MYTQVTLKLSDSDNYLFKALTVILLTQLEDSTRFIKFPLEVVVCPMPFCFVALLINLREQKDVAPLGTRTKSINMEKTINWRGVCFTCGNIR